MGSGIGQVEIVFSGFGGQGALFAGQVLAHAALDHNLHTTWIPSYGPEMRGGTAHCIVIISDDEIGSPVVRNPRAAVVMNLPSLDKYEALIKPGGVLVINESLVDRASTRADVQRVPVRANEIAEELGDKRLANLVLLGALLQRLPVLSLQAVGESLEKHIPAHRRNLLQANLKALQRGAELAAAMPS
jgi:2-oxoglutarate ferredoxin oxidoreductase subunit gamma